MNWNPWHFSRVELIHNIPADLVPPAGAETVPQHAALGRPRPTAGDPNTTFYGTEKVTAVEVTQADGSRELFEDRFYQRVSNGIVERRFDFDGDGKTDHVSMGRLDRNSVRGWPYVGYEPKR